MSEYQYYEFLAIDRPLTMDDMAALRAISTRADITPVSFTNEYNWGDFKGDPFDLMDRFFDAHVYVANWMTAVFMVRLPIEALAEEDVYVMAADYVLELEATETHWIITWCLEDSEDYDRFAMEDGPGWMARLAPMRDELLRGDLRGLYIGWLSAVSRGMMDDDEMEPLVVEGLGDLTPAQLALAEFLEVDDDWLTGAGVDSPERKDEKPTQKEMEEWINDLPRTDVTGILKQLLDGKGWQAERTLKNRFMAWRRELGGEVTEARRRSVGELRAKAEAAQKIRLEKKRHELEQREIELRREREAYLKKLSTNFPKAWREVRQILERKSGGAYDQACRLLVDLSDAYALHSDPAVFQQELKKFMADYMKRKALLQRLEKVGLWDKERQQGFTLTVNSPGRDDEGDSHS